MGSVWMPSVPTVMTTSDGTNTSMKRRPPSAGSGSVAPKIEPKIRRMTVGRAMAASHVMGSRNTSFASVTMSDRISFMTAPQRCGPAGP